MSFSDTIEMKKWTFKKNCSFTPKQVGLFYLAQSTFSLSVAGFFLWRGVWLVLPFTFIELVALGIALTLYARHATDYETISLGAGILKIEISNASIKEEYIWNSHWVQVANSLNERKLIQVSYEGKSKELGKFLHVSVREIFLKEFKKHMNAIR